MHFGLRDLKDLPPLEEFEEALGLEATEHDVVPISEDHEAIGLVSTEEAEATLGSARFGVHEHFDSDADEPAAAADGPEADSLAVSSEGDGESGAEDEAGFGDLGPASRQGSQEGQAAHESGLESAAPPSLERDVVGVADQDRDSGSGGAGGVGGEGSS